jgi:NADPH:quinone reductase-like Zn-dependent oxidoreductase
MKRVVVNRYGGPEVLELVDEKAPLPGPGEARVAVEAAGVSYADLLIRAGAYLGGPKPPFTPGYELVGEVDAVGRGCTTLRAGDRVAALTVSGCYAELICLPEAELVPVPRGLDAAQAVSLVLNYVSAHQLLHRIAAAQPGETVLVHGAAGGVGTAVLELARPELRVLGTASTSKCALVKRMGGEPIDHTNEDFVARVREMTESGVDVALDGIGGGVSVRSFRALRRGGRLVVFGHYSTMANGRRSMRGWLAWYTAAAAVGVAALLSPSKSMRAYRIAKLKERRPDWFRADLAHLLELLRDRQLNPLVAERLRLDEVRVAHERLGRAGVEGKLVLVPGS